MFQDSIENLVCYMQSLVCYFCRTQLTVLHHNENCQRNIKVKSDMTPLFIVHRSKATKQDPRAVTMREEASNG